jgi:hypothetical protein
MTDFSDGEMSKTWTLEHAIDLVRTGAGREGYYNAAGSGGIWAGSNRNIADAQFVDWGLARATAVILNAVVNGQLQTSDEASYADLRASGGIVGAP